MAYWFNVDTRQVESDEDKSQGDHLMGPYDSHEAASKALESARARTEAWDTEDREWEQGRSED
jgi:hypothetical protein